MNQPWPLYIFLALSLNCIGCLAMIEGLYCGLQNCYDMLGVNRDDTKSVIAKSYRQLAKKFHPDLHRTAEAKEVAEEKFKLIASAYEILKDDESRADYDYMLDHPEEYYWHHYRYYRHKVKVDVRVVVAVVITVVSGIQYYSRWYRYNEAIAYCSKEPKYRIKALHIARQDGLLPPENSAGGSRKRSGAARKGGGSKEEFKEEQERIIRQVIEEKMDIRGGYAKPKIQEVLWIQLVILPYTVYQYFSWYISWVWRHNINKEPFGDEEKLYLIRKFMAMSSEQFEALEDSEKEDYLLKELWVKENFKHWKEEKEEEMKRKLAESSKYKSYRRYMRNHGPGRLYFDDD